MNLYLLSDVFPWLGFHTGYSRLLPYIRRLNTNTNVVENKTGLLQRCIGRIYNISHGCWRRRDSTYAAAESRFYRFIKRYKSPGNIFHILYFDLHYSLLEHLDEVPKNLIGTIHCPFPRKIPELMLRSLKRLPFAITLSNCDLERYRKYIGHDRVKFIHHGVDTEFFVPARQKTFKTKRILFTGQNGRNTLMLSRIARYLAGRYTGLRFDILLPKKQRGAAGLRDLENNPSFYWHENLSDRELLMLYQSSYLLLLPMNESSANNAIVEACACGLPVVTTDIGGVRDYGGDSVYPITANNDDKKMIALIDRYLAEPDWRNKIAKRCRLFAEQNLSWHLIAEKHLEAYEYFMNLKEGS